MRKTIILIILIFSIINFSFAKDRTEKEIKINGKITSIVEELTLDKLIRNLKIPLSKVAIELNKEIVNKKNINKIKLYNKDVVEIVHFIGGG